MDTNFEKIPRVCPNCNATVQNGDAFCSCCGAKIGNDIMVDTNIGRLGIIPAPKNRKPKLLMVFLLLLLVIEITGVVLYTSRQPITDDEKWAVENCQSIIDNLKDPDSFKLYKDIEVFRIYDSTGAQIENSVYMFIDYGGTNTYGGTLRAKAGFVLDGHGIMDVNDNIYDIPKSARVDYIALLGIQRSFEEYGEGTNTSGNSIKRSIVSRERIAKILE